MSFVQTSIGCIKIDYSLSDAALNGLIMQDEN